MHIVFDWDGTIVKNYVAQQASLHRTEMLDVGLSEEWLKEAQKTDAHYPVMCKAIGDYTGITDLKKQIRIMTTIFFYHYTAIIKELGKNVFHEGMLEVLQQIKKEFPEARISIATALIQDIIDQSLEVLGIRDLFDKVYATNYELDFNKKDLLEKALHDCKDVHIMIGDRKEDIEAGKHVNAITFATSWGQHDHKELGADYVIHTPNELLELIRKLKK